MLSLGTSADMLMLAVFSYVFVGWPAILTGAMIGLRNSMAIETIAISLVGCVATVVWLYVAGFYDMFPAYAATVISTMCYFVGLVVGHAVRITVQRLMPKPQ